MGARRGVLDGLGAREHAIDGCPSQPRPGVLRALRVLSGGALSNSSRKHRCLEITARPVKHGMLMLGHLSPSLAVVVGEEVLVQRGVEVVLSLDPDQTVAPGNDGDVDRAANGLIVQRDPLLEGREVHQRLCQRR